ncbi:hypothetical protein J120_01155 [candidate division TM6 bacterium JCVI TM6SC1]|uniref:Uncharacterized protein n=1 Tax=candidate division TM6 bacterium JCVI TM6SC1 TaxID=1306947 RepID=A0A0D2GQ95_9BACT|nr:hypothetical protein J120_01155 [candidate division TM6 bacterium JCVI TM6SC1]
MKLLQTMIFVSIAVCNVHGQEARPITIVNKTGKSVSIELRKLDGQVQTGRKLDTISLECNKQYTTVINEPKGGWAQTCIKAASKAVAWFTGNCRYESKPSYLISMTVNQVIIPQEVLDNINQYLYEQFNVNTNEPVTIYLHKRPAPNSLADQLKNHVVTELLQKINIASLSEKNPFSLITLNTGKNIIAQNQLLPVTMSNATNNRLKLYITDSTGQELVFDNSSPNASVNSVSTALYINPGKSSSPVPLKLKRSKYGLITTHTYFKKVSVQPVKAEGSVEEIIYKAPIKISENDLKKLNEELYKQAKLGATQAQIQILSSAQGYALKLLSLKDSLQSLTPKNITLINQTGQSIEVVVIGHDGKEHILKFDCNNKPQRLILYRGPKNIYVKYIFVRHMPIPISQTDTINVLLNSYQSGEFAIRYNPALDSQNWEYYLDSVEESYR